MPEDACGFIDMAHGKKAIHVILFALFLCITPFASGQECGNETPEDFDGFFARFSQDSSFALNRTQFPLQVRVWAYGLTDGKGHGAAAPKKSALSRAGLSRWPGLTDYMAGNGLKKTGQTVTRDDAVVDIGKEGTDWLMAYHFRRHHGCWFFWQYEDKSL